MHRGCHRRTGSPRLGRRKRGIQENALGRSRGGVSTKIHALVDGLGRPLHIALTAGQRHEAQKAEELVDHVRARVFVADGGYDSDRLRAKLKARGIKAVINNAGNRTKKYRVEKHWYRQRYIVECFFLELKRFRGVATRYDKTARNYLSLVSLACAWLWII